MKRKTIVKPVSIGLLVLLGMVCSRPGITDNNTGGSSSEVVALLGAALNADSTAAAYATIRLRPADYLADVSKAGKGKAIIADVVANSKGVFRVDSVIPGAYTVEIAYQKSTGALRTISVALDTHEVHLAPMVLKPVSKLTGTITSPSGAKGPVSVMIYGMERRALADSTGGFAFNDLPEGEYTLRISPDVQALGRCDVPNIVVPAASLQRVDTVTLHTFEDEDYSSWMSSRTVRINTSPSGADVALTVTGFPLLVRLDANNFDFSASRSYKPGADIRFSNAAGKHLPCQIERWDPALHKAEIWVRLDTIRGADSAQFISMYYGNVAAATWQGGKVFDTADGFAAVWHLGQDLDDATLNNIAARNIKTTVAEGLIGDCRYFDGISSFIGIDSSASLNMSGKGPTILLWQRGTHAYAREGMYFEHDVWPQNGDYGLSTRSSTTLSFDYPSADSEVRFSGGALSDGGWHFVASVKYNQDSRGVVYYDGDSVAGGPMRSAIGSSGGQSFIGSRGGTSRFFEGYIDEMWVLSRPLSGSFIKLVYENQRLDQRLLLLQ